MFGHENRWGQLAAGCAVAALLAMTLLVGCKKSGAGAGAGGAGGAGATAAGGRRGGRAGAQGGAAMPAGGRAGAGGSAGAAGSRAGRLPGAATTGAALTPAGAQNKGVLTPTEAKIDPAVAAKVANGLVDEAMRRAHLKPTDQAVVAMRRTFTGKNAEAAAAGLRRQPKERKRVVAWLASALKADATGVGLTDGDAVLMKAMLGPTGKIAQPLPYAEVVKEAKIQKFAAVYGPVVWVKERNFDGRIIEWVTFKYARRNIKFPVSLIMDSKRIGILRPFFDVYNNTGISKAGWKKTIIAPKGLKEKVLAEDKKITEAAKKVKAVPVESAAAGGAGAAAGGGAAGGGGGGGMGRGGGGGGMGRGGGGGGMRRGGGGGGGGGGMGRRGGG